jgi:hypothetical protein
VGPTEKSLTLPINFVEKLPTILCKKYEGEAGDVRIVFKKDKNRVGGFWMIMWRCDGDSRTKKGEAVWKVLEFFKKPLDDVTTVANFQLETEGWVRCHIESYDMGMAVKVFGPDLEEDKEEADDDSKKRALDLDEVKEADDDSSRANKKAKISSE